VIGDYLNLLTNMMVRIRPLFRYEQNLLELAALQEISRQVSLGVDLDHVLDSILDATVTRLGFEFVVINLVETDRGIIRALKGVGVPESWIRRAVFTLDGPNIRADIVRTGQLEIVDGWDARLDQRLWKKHGQNDMVRVFAPITIVDPVTQRERTIGVVEAGCRKQRRATLDDQQVAMLRSFVNQAAVAIEKAHLFDRMAEKTAILTSLHSVGRAIAAARDLPSVWEEIATSAQRILNADIVMLYPYREEEHRILAPHVRGTLYGSQPPDYMLKEAGILAKIVRDKTAYYAADALRDPYLNPIPTSVVPKTGEAKHRSFTQRQNVRSFAGLPLLAGGHIIGIMCVNFRRRHLFGEDEQQILDLFAQQAAIALKNAEINALERQVTADEERSRLSRELHESVSQYLPAIKFMATTAREQLGRCPDETAAWLEKIQSAANAVLNDVEYNLFQLKPVTLEHGLAASVDADIQFLKNCFGSNITLSNRLAESLDATVQGEVFMVIREAMTNAARHAHASQVQVRLATRKGLLYFLVRDDGRGFDPEHLSPKPHHGLQNMQARMDLIGGSLHIRSAPAAGTIIRGRVCSRSNAHDMH
jgi:signal transduction histidine kinase